MVEQLDFLPEDGGSIPTSPLQLKFRPITDHTLNLIVIKNHYAHRGVPTSWAFGAYFENILLGVISFGKPASPSLCIGVCGHENSDRIYELNRLWMDDKCPRNSESRFIGWALRELKNIKPSLIIVSYADTKQNHLGMVYKATNFIYTGLSTPMMDKVVGDKHSRHSWDDPEAIWVERSRKHRYVFFCDTDDKKWLKYQILPYPKT